MDILMDIKSMQELAKQMAKNLKIETVLYQFISELTKMVAGSALGAEMEEDLGYSERAAEVCGRGNSLDSNPPPKKK